MKLRRSCQWLTSSNEEESTSIVVPQARGDQASGQMRIIVAVDGKAEVEARLG